MEQCAAQVRNFLGVSLESNGSYQDDDSALKQWRYAVERAGIFVYKNMFEQKSISSFCLSDAQFPIIYLNNSTTKTRQIFSLFHELAHILLRMNGLTKFDENYMQELPRRERTIEKFCNEFAAELLIPRADFSGYIDLLSGNADKVDEICQRLAKRYGVSREAVLRRFLDQDKISSHFYENRALLWAGQQKKSDSGGGDYYQTKKTYLSDSFSREVFSRFYRRQITKDEASEYLDIKPKHFDSLEEKMFWRIEA